MTLNERQALSWEATSGTDLWLVIVSKSDPVRWGR